MPKSRASSSDSLWLFDPPKVELPQISVSKALGSIRWSYSRRSTLEQCARKYFYEYYGANKRYSKHDETRKSKLRFLKKLVSRHELAGQIVHRTMANYFRYSRQAAPNVKEMQKDADKQFAKALEDSRAFINGNSTSSDYSTLTVLLEFYYRRKDAEDGCIEVRDRMLSSLFAFATSSSYREARVEGSKPGASIERRFKRLNGFQCSVEGVIDLSYIIDNVIVVIDWKTGLPSSGSDDSLQLLTYAFWASEQFSYLPKSVVILKGYLSSGELIPFQATKDILASARARILQDAERMLSMDSYGRSDQESAFTPCGQQKICALCPYLEMCQRQG